VSAVQPLVSICMPVFNAERWVGAALDSALRQAYTEFELIVADNASTDRTLEIVRSFDDSRVRIQTADQDRRCGREPQSGDPPVERSVREVPTRRRPAAP